MIICIKERIISLADISKQVLADQINYSDDEFKLGRKECVEFFFSFLENYPVFLLNDAHEKEIEMDDYIEEVLIEMRSLATYGHVKGGEKFWNGVEVGIKNSMENLKLAYEFHGTIYQAS